MTALTVSDAVCVYKEQAVLGESPLWHPGHGKLFWLDIKGGKLHAYRPDTGAKTHFWFDGMISAIALAAEHDFICVHEHGFAYLDLVGERVERTPIIDPEVEKPENRFNDGKIGPDGAFWAGTMENAETYRTGTWWRLMPDGRCTAIDAEYMVTNGPAFDPDRERVYLTDSADQCVFVATPTPDGIQDKRPFLQFGPGDGYPDGMCVDAEGCLWIAFWDGACVRRFNADGQRIGEFSVPVPRPTSVALVADRLFVTSASTGLSEAMLTAFPQSGGLFEFQLSRSLQRPGQMVFTPQ